MPRLTSSTLVPISAVVTAITATYFAAGAINRHDVAIETTKVRIDAVEKSQDQTAERLDRIVDDLAQIKERLGIVESHPKR